MRAHYPIMQIFVSLLPLLLHGVASSSMHTRTSLRSRRVPALMDPAKSTDDMGKPNIHKSDPGHADTNRTGIAFKRVNGSHSQFRIEGGSFEGSLGTCYRLTQ